MDLNIKKLSRPDWPRILKRKYVHMPVSDERFSGQAALMLLEEVSAPLVKTYDTHALTIVDQGFFWLQLAPKDKRYWLTVVLNPAGEIVQYYFDITDGNVICEEGDSYFYDLYLDVVLLPGGEMFLLDEDELLSALMKNVISKTKYQHAAQTARMLMKALPDCMKELEAYCHRMYFLLREMLPKQE